MSLFLEATYPMSKETIPTPASVCQLTLPPPLWRRCAYVGVVLAIKKTTTANKQNIFLIKEPPSRFSYIIHQKLCKVNASLRGGWCARNGNTNMYGAVPSQAIHTSVYTIILDPALNAG